LTDSSAVMKRTKHYKRYGAVTRGLKRPSHAGSVLSGALPNIALGPRLTEYRVKRDWPQMVGKAISARTEPTRLIKDTLYCVVNSSAWMTELNYQKSLIMEKINSSLGKKAVSRIVWKPAEITRRSEARREPITRKNPLGDDFIEETASKIGDESLRGLVKRVMKKYPF